MSKKPTWQRPATKTALLRGAKGLCPKCGDAKLFRAYLKPVESCGSCGKNWTEVRADDAPAWLTILITGHVLAPFFHFFVTREDLPMWAPGLILSGLAVIISLILLPRTKGAFMGLIWLKGIPTS